jgi:hypothetical protein
MSIIGKRLVTFIQAMFFGLAASLLVEFFSTNYGLLGALMVIGVSAGFAYGFGVLSVRLKAHFPELIISLISSMIPLIFVVRALTSDNSRILVFALLTIVIAIFVFIGVRVKKSKI